MFGTDFKILQLMQTLPGPGRFNKVGGFDGLQIFTKLVMSISRVLESPVHRDLAVAVKNRLLKIVGEYLSVDAITQEEI